MWSFQIMAIPTKKKKKKKKMYFWNQSARNEACVTLIWNIQPVTM